jgi:hypothetical protein
MIVFQIPSSGRNVRLPSLKVWLWLALYGRIPLGRFGKFDWHGFKCATCKALKADYIHGYHNGEYYLECRDCGYKHLCGNKM